MPAATSSLLGAQLWIERDDDPQRVAELVAQAAGLGLGWLRLFLMWPFIEPRPGELHWAAYDAAFDAAAHHGLRIKATLTANSGPWHVGTPSLLHSHTGIIQEAWRPVMAAHIDLVVARYAGHPALGQWLAWNEPIALGVARHEGFPAFFRVWLERRYGAIAALNAAWRTGYEDFAQVPLATEVVHPVQAECWPTWRAQAPEMEQQQAEQDFLVQEVAWVAERIRAIDPRTPIGANPLFACGEDAPWVRELAQRLDVVGTSLHPGHVFGLQPRSDWTALVAGGVATGRLLSGGRPFEVTELQGGPTPTSAGAASTPSDGELARWVLAALGNGAASVHLWSLNVRQDQNEVGEWAALDADDRPTARAVLLRRVAALAAGFAHCPATPEVRDLVLVDADGMLADQHVAQRCTDRPGRAGVGRLDVLALLATRGRGAGLARLDDLDAVCTPANARGALLIASRLMCWDAAQAARLLPLVEAGATLVLDAPCGRLDHRAALHHPAPGGLSAAIGLRLAELEGCSEDLPLRLHGLACGRGVLWRARLADLDPAWSPVAGLRFADDGSAAALERRYGQGRIVYARWQLGPSLRHDPATAAALHHVLDGAVSAAEVTALTPGTVVLPVQWGGRAVRVVLAGDLLERRGQELRLAATGTWRDHWSAARVVAAGGELALPAAEGIAILERA